jgi:hypothetical protein
MRQSSAGGIIPAVNIVDLRARHALLDTSRHRYGAARSGAYRTHNSALYLTSANRF